MVNEFEKNRITHIALEGIRRIKDVDVCTSLRTVYSNQEIIETGYLAQRVFDTLTSSKWRHSTLCDFLAGWRSTHGTALFVSGLIVRVHREAVRSVGTASELLYKAAAELSEIISEDTGVDDVPHNELFTVFADTLVGDDSWKLDKHLMPACEAFRRFVKKERLEASIEEAILMTAASENWNTGEYTYFEMSARNWMTKVLGVSETQAERASPYIEHHSGETELGHFVHAIKAWKLYCEAIGKLPNPEFAKEIFSKYINAIRPSYVELYELLNSAIEHNAYCEDILVADK